MSAYYNEHDAFAAQWLRNLIAAGHIAPGVVDERDIQDVRPDDLREFEQCHFFAGIGGWSLALRLAGWADDRRIWTGSCPCQPFSQAGAGDGLNDERHLWPSWFWLIAQCRPAIVVGEQVASKDAEPWLDLVRDDMEGLGHAFAAVAFPAASVGAPHIRDRCYWMGHADDARLEGLGRGHRAEEGQRQTSIRSTAAAGSAVRMADAGREAAGPRRGSDGEGPMRDEPGARSGGCGAAMQQGAGPVNGFWRAADWLHGRDGKWRPVEPGTFPLVDGFSGRMEQLRGYGNAIVPQQAAEVIRILMEHAP